MALSSVSRVCELSSLMQLQYPKYHLFLLMFCMFYVLRIVEYVMTFFAEPSLFILKPFFGLITYQMNLPGRVKKD